MCNMQRLRQRITELLVEKQLLNTEQLQYAVRSCQSQKSRLSQVLIEQNLVDKEAVIEFLQQLPELRFIDSSVISALKIDPQTLSCIPKEIALQYRILPLELNDNKLKLALSDPMVLLDLEDLPCLSNFEVEITIGSQAEMRRLIDTQYEKEVSPPKKEEKLEDILGGIAEVLVRPQEEADNAALIQAGQEVPVIKATDFLLHRAIEMKASDILIEPMLERTRIRFRIDGILQEIESLPKNLHPFIISRVKVISNLDIAEHRLPQDGQFKIKTGGKEVEFRVSIFPSVVGEKSAIRLLDKSLGLMDIDHLGLGENELKKIKSAAGMPHGMILVCGPTGSGKTSTLYSILNHIYSPDINIITVEDPVEYQIKGINQVSVNPKVGLTFSRCLRSILRQDPDVIMVGEIRDFETVDIAIKAALTGHLVLSTLHTTTTAGSIVRLVDMGVEPFLINASLVCIVVQRLARRICTSCKEKIEGQSYYRGRGCKECFQSGYKGRVLVPEVLYMTPEIRQEILSANIEEKQIKDIAASQGMKSLRQEGERLAQLGITTVEEIARVTPADQ